jgi:hypothetical protein
MRDSLPKMKLATENLEFQSFLSNPEIGLSMRWSRICNGDNGDEGEKRGVVARSRPAPIQGKGPEQPSLILQGDEAQRARKTPCPLAFGTM